MSRAEKNIHPPYYMIEGYAKLAGYNLYDLAKSMNLHYRTLLRKINGYSDFKETESQRLSAITGRKKADLFLTRNV